MSCLSSSGGPQAGVRCYVKFGEIGHRASTQLLGCGEARGTGTSHSFPVCRDTARQPLGGVSAERQSSKRVSRPGSRQPAREGGVSRASARTLSRSDLLLDQLEDLQG